MADMVDFALAVEVSDSLFHGIGVVARWRAEAVARHA